MKSNMVNKNTIIDHIVGYKQKSNTNNLRTVEQALADILLLLKLEDSGNEKFKAILTKKSKSSF